MLRPRRASPGGLTFGATSARRCRRSPASLRRSRSARKASASSPPSFGRKLAERFALIGVQGIVRMAMAGFDIACWDALRNAAGVPLVRLLGGEPRRILAYNSCGLGLMPADALADEAEKLLANGFRAIKLRLGYPTLDEDLAAVHAVKKRIPDGIALMVDYNQALGTRRGAQARPRARSRGHRLAGGADPSRRLRWRGDAGPRTRRADPDRRKFFARCRDADRARCPAPAIW